MLSIHRLRHRRGSGPRQKLSPDGRTDDTDLVRVKGACRGTKRQEDALNERTNRLIRKSRMSIGFEDHPGDALERCCHDHHRTGVASDADHEVRAPLPQNPPALQKLTGMAHKPLSMSTGPLPIIGFALIN